MSVVFKEEILNMIKATGLPLPNECEGYFINYGIGETIENEYVRIDFKEAIGLYNNGYEYEVIDDDGFKAVIFL